ncbi:MAG: PRC-barrel domain-containing protein [Endomicrobiales bacterium]
MLRKASDLIGRTIRASDGDIGEIRDYYFDDKHWVLRYFVVDTSPWIDDREALLSTECFINIDWGSNEIPASLTREQVKNSPGAPIAPPLLRQKETQLFQFEGWPSYWHRGTMYTKPLLGAESGDLETAVEDQDLAPYLRSAREVLGYAVQGTDARIGAVTDFIVDDTCWALRYMLVTAGSWMNHRRMLIAPEWAGTVDWGNAEIPVALPKETVYSAPAYDPSVPVSREYEEQLCRHYRFPRYWNRKKQKSP